MNKSVSVFVFMYWTNSFYL